MILCEKNVNNLREPSITLKARTLSLQVNSRELRNKSLGKLWALNMRQLS